MERLSKEVRQRPGRGSGQTRCASQSAPGLGQLTLVEHALCPLNPRTALVKNLVFNTAFVFTDKNRHTQTADVSVFCPRGLCAGDELYLWGLLALTLEQPAAGGMLIATPHFVLRSLGLIDQHSRRGGRQYQHFAAALERLAAVTYQSDGFYDPLRGEHRRVSFGFLSYSLPVNDRSERTWRIAWDPIFFEFAKGLGGHLWFDLSTYRKLDPASRRLFLFLSKVFWRRQTTPCMPLRHVGQNVLGFSKSLIMRDLKVKVSRCVSRLAEHQIVANPTTSMTRMGRGQHVLTLQRGAYFDRRSTNAAPSLRHESPVCDPLRSIGFDAKAIARLLTEFPTPLLQEWSDITLAAKEQYGMAFFTRSPQAYFVDNVRHAAKEGRTPPDWWHDLRKSEQRRQSRSPGGERNILNRIRDEMSRRAPQTEPDAATKKPVASSAHRTGRSTTAARQPQRLRSILAYPESS